jgi:hypothetical protein
MNSEIPIVKKEFYVKNIIPNISLRICNASIAQLLSDRSFPRCTHITIVIGLPAWEMIYFLMMNILCGQSQLEHLKTISLLKPTDFSNKQK